jgi:hypothetical protein
MIRAPTTSLGSSEPDLYQPSLPLFLTSVDSTISVLKLPFNNSTHTAVALCLPAWPPLHTHSNARKPIPFISLLHSSHHTPGCTLSSDSQVFCSLSAISPLPTIFPGINTSKFLSKQTPSTPFRINAYEKHRERVVIVNRKKEPPASGSGPHQCQQGARILVTIANHASGISPAGSAVNKGAAQETSDGLRQPSRTIGPRPSGSQTPSQARTCRLMHVVEVRSQA